MLASAFKPTVERPSASQSNATTVAPEVAEFVQVIAPYLTDTAVVASGEEVKVCGLADLDVLIVDGDESIGIGLSDQLSSTAQVPAGLGACYRMDATDAATHLEDAVYLLSRWHPTLFRPGSSLSLASVVSTSALVKAADHAAEHIHLSGSGSSESPALIDRRVSRVQESSRTAVRVYEQAA